MTPNSSLGVRVITLLIILLPLITSINKDNINSTKSKNSLPDFKCVHQEILETHYKQHYQPVSQQHRRNLGVIPIPTSGGSDTGSIRITTDTSQMQAFVTDASKKQFLVDQVAIAKSFYQTRLQVVRETASITAPDPCGGYATPSNDQSTGISSTDIHFYVTAESNSGVSYLAYALSCSRNGVTSRPVVARLNYNVFYVTDVNERTFKQSMDTTLHEMLHALGFSSSSFPLFVQPDGSAMYGVGVTETVTLRGLSTNIIKTPKLVALAQSYFGCNTMTGMQLENEGGAGSAGSHWERALVYDELMTASKLGASQTFSEFSFTLLEDSNWYLVDKTDADRFQNGYNEGCDFITNACQSADKVYKQYCPSAGGSYCSGNRLAKGTCDKPHVFTDTCGTPVSYDNAECIDPADSASDSSATSAQQSYDIAARCFESTLGGGGSLQCHQYNCLDNGFLEIIVGDKQLLCDEDEKVLNDQLGMVGSFQCPKLNKFCLNQKQLCKNWCSSKGNCMAGTCNCIPGRSGQDCSNSTCSSVQYVSISGSSCVSSCGGAEYGNIYNRACMPCHSTCATCSKGGKTGCLTCPVGKVLTPTKTCQASCPAQYYNNAATPAVCITCNAACTTCDGGASTDCLSCPDPKWLQSKQCVVSCLVGLLKDAEFRECSSTCRTTQYNNNGNCEKCANGTYIILGTNSCVAAASCPDGTYANSTDNTCSTCDSTCSKCTGSSKNQCTACGSSKFLFGSQCLDECPVASYGNTTTRVCSLCDAQCIACTGSLATQCSDCRTGYYIQGTSCLDTCPDGTYKNVAKRTCSPCHAKCQTCKNERDNGCLSCPSNLSLLTSGTGKSCLEQCSDGYYASQNTCLQCNPSCTTCKGGAETDCTLCKADYYQHTDGRCLYMCPDKFYGDQSLLTCNACDSTCLTCSGPSSSECKTCDANSWLLNQNSCVAQCPNPALAKATSRRCESSLLSIITILLMIFYLI